MIYRSIIGFFLTVTLGTAIPDAHADGIVTATVLGQGVFQTTDGARFIARGANYVRLGAGGWHDTLEPATYDGPRADAAFAAMAAQGYNLVRITLDCPSFQGGFGLWAPGLPDTYVATVADVITRAAAHGLRVLLTFSSIPPNYLIGLTPPAQVSGATLNYLDPAYVTARAQVWSDLLTALVRTAGRAILAPVFGIDAENEAEVGIADQPWSATAGTFTLYGIDFDLSDPASRQWLLDLAAIVWMDTQAAAIHAVDPSLLVSTSVFSPVQAGFPGFNGVQPVAARPGATRYPLRPMMLMALSAADYVDIHEYSAGVGWNYAASLASAEITAATPWPKPLLLSEYGAAVPFYADEGAAGADMQAEMAATCAAGVSGWAIWTWDTTEQTNPAFYTADGLLGTAIGPQTLPQPCEDIAAGDFVLNDTGAAQIFHSTGNGYCTYASPASWQAATGGDALNLPSYSRIPLDMISTGLCSAQ
ncbi:hypothetical protein Asru_0478_06 [Acidisphaera rubrifaciens HS-AP3]|uniref:Glycoside hydrolase family 5 domain-containing protein n=1 Tax=Acidisphaera rubrifaciens HS-AP3 TaxID=1231350 RepID=A0A0D6P847_9PROT|nr:hypothetical protein Asru_0478_06 [Acidisphaera rubrifaciens HS-AP3]